MEDTAPQLSNAQLGVAFFVFGLLMLVMAWISEREKVGPGLARFIRLIAFTSAFKYEEPATDEWKTREPPKRSKWLFLWSWLERVPQTSRVQLIIALASFIAAIGFWITSWIKGT
jgi:hypothetical protein